MGLSLVTDATSLPWTLSDFTAEIVGYVQSTANDAVCTAVLNAATKWVQNQTCRQFIQATWLQSCNRWPYTYSTPFLFPADALGSGGIDYAIPVALQPLVSVSSVKYYDTNGTQQTVSTSHYWAITVSIPPKVAFDPTLFTWPNVQVGRPEPIEIRFVAGYASAAVVPYDLKRAIHLLARYWYELHLAASPIVASQDPAQSQPVNYGEIPFGVWSIVNMYKADGYT